jgi:Uri superfamily endonuclease
MIHFHGEADVYEQIPAESGTYTLVFSLSDTKSIRVGGLGEHCFPAGNYVYVGSAHGSGGLRARLRHHFYKSKNPRWHIDWVRLEMELIGCFFIIATEKMECRWSELLANWRNSRVILPGFGAGDCRSGCPAHFYFLLGRNNLDGLESELLQGFA